MSELYDFVERTPGIRVRPEGEGTFLLYHPGTDELHLVDGRSKTIFELCDGRTIDDVVDEGAALICTADGSDEKQAAAEVLTFLCSLQQRSLVRFF